MFVALLLAAVLTCFIETIVISILLKREKLQDLKLNIVLINLITNLTLNISLLTLNMIGTNDKLRTCFMVVAELIIPVIEYFMLRYCYSNASKIKLFLASCIANIISFCIGLLIF